MHDLPVNQDLIGAKSVARRVCGICGRGNLYFAPFAVGGDQLALGSAGLEFLVDALLVNTALSLYQRRCCNYVGKYKI
jgi:hypothetical protein